MEKKNASFKYRAFLSYSHEDKKWARWLHRSLENYRVPPHLNKPGDRATGPPNRIAPVFRDRTDLSSAACLPDAINEALEASESLIVICSPAAAQSRWVNEEILAFKRLGRAHRVFCFIVAGEPNMPGEVQCFPKAVRFDPENQESDITSASEPLAADARPLGDGRKTARLKLIAGLLGVGFDELCQRDLQRRHRRMLGITAGSFVTALLTLSLAIMAFMANAEAERRRLQAEDLVGFMLGDLREKLHEIGRLDLFTVVNDKVLDYFTSMTDEGHNDEVLHQKAEVLRQIGEVRINQGEATLALESFRESLTIAQQLANRNPLNADWQIALANSHFYIGYIHWQRDELEAARREFEATLPIVSAVSEREPNNTEWLVERGYVYTNLGRVLEVQGQLSQALDIYLESKVINDRLVELAPDNTEYRLELGFAHNSIGNIMQSLGQFDAAEEHFDRDLEIKLAVSAEYPDHNLWSSYAATSHVYKGRILAVRGQYAGAHTQYALALSRIESLLAIDPEHTDWLEKLASYERELGAITRRELAVEEAIQHIDTSVNTFERLVEIDDSMTLWQRGLAISQLEAARLERMRHDYVLALDFATVANSSLAILLEHEPSNQKTKNQYAISQMLLGDICADMGNHEIAKQVWGEAVRIVESEGAAMASLELVDLYSALLLRLGRNTEANPLFARLKAIGYHSMFE